MSPQLTRSINTTSVVGLVACLLAVGFHIALIAHGQYLTSGNGPPRFRQNARSHQYAYLGDSVRFRCTAVGRPQPKVHWYRNGGYLNHSLMQAHPRFREKSMSLEIRRIEVGDKGNWMCRVWNNEGSTTRNFTLHIVNYCEYFLEVPADGVPDECACEWARHSSVYEANASADKPSSRLHSGGLTEARHVKIRTDLDLSAYDESRCAAQNFSEEIPLTTSSMKVVPTTLLATRTVTSTASNVAASRVTKAQPTGFTTTYDDYGRASDKPPARVEPHVNAKQTEIHFLDDKNEQSGPGRPLNRIRITLEHPDELPFASTEPIQPKSSLSVKNSTNREKTGFSGVVLTKKTVSSQKYIQRLSATAKTTLKYRVDPLAMSHDKDRRPAVFEYDLRNVSMAKSQKSLQPPSPVNGSHNNYFDIRKDDGKASDIPSGLNISLQNQQNILSRNEPDVSSPRKQNTNPQSIPKNKLSFEIRRRLPEAAVFSSQGHQISSTVPTMIETQRRENVVQSSDVTPMKSQVIPTAIEDFQPSQFAVSEYRTTANPTTNPSQLFDHLSESGVPDVAHLLPDLIPPGGMRALRDALTAHWRVDLDSTAKSALAARIVANLSSVGVTRQEGAYDSAAAEGETDDDEDDDEDRNHYHDTKKTISQDQADNRTIGRIRPTIAENRTTWPGPPTRVAPYFRQMDRDVNENVVLPAGRTLKLACRSGGQPEPQVIWRKDNVEIQRDTESRTGSLYHIRRWSLELEDATESDSGDYECEVFNSVGWIVRRFRVDVQDRLRSRPIIVPNVLLNRTVDANSTVRFTCQVISDLVPHIVWIKLVRRNGSFIRIDAARNQQSFNFIDMSTIKKANLYQDSKTNKYTLEIVNVTMEDQGIYSCVAGNTLGMSMANATLTVNEFRPMTLPTENPYQWPFTYTVLLAVGAVLLMAFLALSILYCSFFGAESTPKRHRVQSYNKIAVRKKVIITKKPERSGDVWSDLASSYAITVEPVLSGGSGLALDGGGGSAGGLTDALLGDIGGHMSAPSDTTPLSEYEVPTDATWEIDRSKLQLIDILGEGAFGEVLKGVLRVPNANGSDESRVPVAVKKLKPTANEKELIILVSEMQILKSIGEHRNILRLVGCCTGVGPLLVVLEVCPHGNLRDFLRKHRPRENDLLYEDEEEDEEEFENSGEFSAGGGGGRRLPRRVVMYQNVENPNEAIIKNLTLRDIVQFSTEIARGMEFLASKKIIHRDLAARNVLVAENYTMKISDFGLSRNVFYQDYYRKRGAGRLPIKWMAPEALEANVYTVYSDVWSYGILLWEIMTLGGTPYPSIAMPQLYNILKEGYRMEAPHNCPDEVYGVMVMCWQDKPEQRPQFQIIADYFDWMLTEAANYAMRSDDGETTDEGPYAVINETLNHPAGRIVAGANGGQQTTGSSRPRPLSAPGIISFEAFANREAAGCKAYCAAESIATVATCQMFGSRSCEDDLTGDDRAPLLGLLSTGGGGSKNSSISGHLGGTARKKSSLIWLIQSERPHHAEAPPASQPRARDEPSEGHLYTNTLDVLGSPSRSGLIGDVSARHNSDSFFVDSAIDLPLILSPLDRSAEANDSAMTTVLGFEGVHLTTRTNENNRLLSAIEEDNNSSTGDDDSAIATPSASRLVAKLRNTHEYVNELVRLSPLFASQQVLSVGGGGDGLLRRYARKSNSSNTLSSGGHAQLPSQMSAVLTTNSSSKSLGPVSSSSSGSTSSSSPSTLVVADAAIKSNALLNGQPAASQMFDEQPTAAAKIEKRSVASGHALRINAVSGEAPPLFRSINQQVNQKNGSTLSKASKPSNSGLGSSTIPPEMSPQNVGEKAVAHLPPDRLPASDTNNNLTAKFLMAPTVSVPRTRSISAESQASSGRGGSSAMSSADALGAHSVVPATKHASVQYAIVHAPPKKTIQ